MNGSLILAFTLIFLAPLLFDAESVGWAYVGSSVVALAFIFTRAGLRARRLKQEGRLDEWKAKQK